MSEYPNTGILFDNSQDKKSDKAPDFKGRLEGLDEEVLKNAMKTGNIEIAGWAKTSRNGNQFISLRASVPYKERSGGGDPEF